MCLFDQDEGISPHTLKLVGEQTVLRDARGGVGLIESPDPLVAVTKYGVLVPPAGLHLDARFAPGTVFVSHAHSDHCSLADRILCTPDTARMHEARRGCRDAMPVPFEERTQFGDVSVTLTPAGHTLGSAMITVHAADGVVSYTGDYKLRPNPFSPAVTIPRCDSLIMECTFGDPRYRFPPDDVLLDQLFSFIDAALADGATPVVLAYALGKGQEAMYHLTRRGYDVVAHGAIAKMCALHESLGATFPGPGRWERYKRGDVRGRVLLTTPSTRKTPMVEALGKRRVVYLTGWAYHPGAHNMYKDCDLVLPLSDHADYDELVRTAVESGASRIHTLHGPPRFADRLRELGLNATHLVEHPQAVTSADDVRDNQLGLEL